jgi:hypothetical protein
VPIAFEVLAAHLLADISGILQIWLPNGRRQGREWCVGSLQGERGQSLQINIDSGRWSDFATGDKGGDLISLYAALHGLSQGDAAQQLGAQDFPVARSNGAAHPSGPEPEPIEHPPGNAPLDLHAFRHSKQGLPAHRYVYRDADGAPLYVVARYEQAGGEKTFVPWSWRRGEWAPKGYPKPRPLYGLQRLAALTRRIIVVEGEKAADALQSVVQLSPVISWSHGAGNWRYADWTPLAGRAVLLWPDADPPGVAAMQGITAVLLELRCRVWRVDVEGLPEAYDAADAVLAGLTGAALNEWLQPRITPVERDLPREPQRVRAPQVVAPERTTLDGEADPVVLGDKPSGYAVATAFGLKLGSRGPHQNLSNAQRLVQGLIEKSRDLPGLWWDSFLGQVRTATGEWADKDTLALLAGIQERFEFEKLSHQTLDQAIALYAWEHPRNCAQEWLTSLTWDGTERLDFVLSDGFGTAHNAYTQSVGRCFLMGMVARVCMPGCQVDNLPVFEGAQGITKSQALRALGGAWYAEAMESVLSKDFYLALQGKMLVEIAEFSSFRTAENEAIKAAISRPTDRYRAPYGKRAEDHPRSNVFAATTNEREWNRDPTGARRFWPVACGTIDVGWLSACREQLFAEAVARVHRVPEGTAPIERVIAGAAWWDVPLEAAREEQAARFESDTVAEAMRHYVSTRAEGFTTLDVIWFGLGLDGPQRYDRAIQQRVSRQLVQWGYTAQLKAGATDKVWYPSAGKPAQ